VKVACGGRQSGKNAGEWRGDFFVGLQSIAVSPVY